MSDSNRHRPITIVALVPLVWLASTILSAATSLAADEWVQLAIPLDPEGCYSLRDLYAECNRQLGSKYDLDHLTDRRLPLTISERAALYAASQARLLEFQVAADRLVLRLPNRKSEGWRSRNRQRLEQLLGMPLPEWPADKGLHLPKNFDQSRRTLVLLHGLHSGTLKLQPLIAACQHWGVQPVVFDYPGDGPLQRSGERLSAELRAFSAKYPEAQVALVAHSMGGLVARYCLETPDKNPGCVTDLFTLGTPHHGSHLAVAADWLDLIDGAWPTAAPNIQNLVDGLGSAADDLVPDSSFLADLNRRRRPPKVRYHVAIGRKGYLTAEQQQQVADELDAVCRRRQVAADVRSQVVSLLRCEELQTGRGDGAVSIESARLPDATSERMFDLNHLDWLNLPPERPEESEVFRWIVDTLHWTRIEEHRDGYQH